MIFFYKTVTPASNTNIVIHTTITCCDTILTHKHHISIYYDMTRCQYNRHRIAIFWYNILFSVTIHINTLVQIFHCILSVNQVMLWKTNFDTKSYREILEQHSRRATANPSPHLTDIHPRVPHPHQTHTPDIQVLYYFFFFLHMTPISQCKRKKKKEEVLTWWIVHPPRSVRGWLTRIQRNRTSSSYEKLATKTRWVAFKVIAVLICLVWKLCRESLVRKTLFAWKKKISHHYDFTATFWKIRTP